MSGILLLSATFLACVVEMVEALTIVLAVGITRGWRSALAGGAIGALSLAVIIVVFGEALTERVDIEVLRLLIGTLLLIFGLQWLRKAILRASGRKSLHDEITIFGNEVKALGAVSRGGAELLDWLGFTVSFKGVFLEGLEVAFIVLTFGTSIDSVILGGAMYNGIWAASVAALAALVIVAAVGVAVHRPLARVPENQLKLTVGIMLTSFGTFWAGEGLGVEWPGTDLSILALLVLFSLAAWGTIVLTKRAPQRAAAL
ncbi:MAG TPA: hypothetical protein VHX16_14270 [Chloroflexota bacterium]|jgi:uncharacterized membrane protein|nr:hypothetical protein [Chloroflexota bacterium]